MPRERFDPSPPVAATGVGASLHPARTVAVARGAPSEGARERRARPLPDRLRPQAEVGVLDVTEYFADTSGGIRTYLLAKGAYVEARAALRQVLVVPGAHERIESQSGVRRYELYGPPIPAQKPYRFLLNAPALRRIVLHERPDLIEVGSPAVAAWLALLANRRTDIPLVWFYHANIPRLFAAHYDAAPLRARWAEAYLGKLGGRFAATIATSAFSERDLLKAGVRNVERVPLGVDLERFHPRRRTNARATRARYGLPDAPLALYCGRIAREKELDVLLDAWADVELRTGAHLCLVGAGPYEARLRARSPGRGVHWLGFEHDRDRLADLYAAVELYVSPCSIETFGIAALEAQAAGTAVLSADQGGVAERVERSGAGALFAAGDRRSLAEAAVELFRGDLAGLGSRARADAESEHAWPRVFARIFEIYKRVLG